jgi:hypothetical protein
MPLISVDQVKQFVKSDTTYDEWLYAEAIASAESYLRDKTDREWVEVTGATTASARTFRPRCGETVLNIHDAASITSVVENGVTLTAGTDYVADPLNNLSTSGQWRPSSQLHRYAQAWYTDGPKATVTVTAKWGWSTLPAGITIALCVCAKAYIMERDVAFGLVALGEDGTATGARDAKAVRDFIAEHARYVALVR